MSGKSVLSMVFDRTFEKVALVYRAPSTSMDVIYNDKVDLLLKDAPVKMAPGTMVMISCARGCVFSSEIVLEVLTMLGRKHVASKEFGIGVYRPASEMNNVCDSMLDIARKNLNAYVNQFVKVVR